MLHVLTILALLLIWSPAWAAFPTVASSNNGGDGSAGTSHTINLPASISSGDLLLIHLTCRTAATVIGTISGWSTNLTYNTQVSQKFFYKIADGGEGASTSVTTDLSVACSYVTFRITGHDAGTAPEHGTTANASSSANPDSPSETPSWGAADTLWISWFGATGLETVSTWPTDYTGNQIRGASAAVSNTITVTSTRATNATSQDPSAYTISGAQNWAANTTAIRPASASTSRPMSPILFH
jgi:hypothetical protein